MTSVAFLVDQLFSPAPGGMGTYVRELLPRMAAADPSLELRPFHARFEAAEPEPWLRRYPMTGLSWEIRRLYPSWALLGRPALPESLGSADVVHSPVPAAVPAARRGQKLVVTVHDVAFLTRPDVFPQTWRLMYRAGLRAAVRRADALIVPSRHTAEDLIRRTKADPRRVHVVPLAAAPAEPGDPLDTEEALSRLKIRPPFILFVGTLEPRKNLVRLVRAYRRLAARGAPHRLVLAGPIGWRPQALMRELEAEGPGEVVMTGKLDLADLDVVYRSADLFVYPSLYEGFGLPVLEAMARGLPCVVSTSSSLPEVAGEAGFPVDPLSEAGIADAMERVATDPVLAARLREAGVQRAGRYSWEETARLTLDVYKVVLSS
jgi:glycosyltransferase involved in cell wall biosynthesis